MNISGTRNQRQSDTKDFEMHLCARITIGHKQLVTLSEVGSNTDWMIMMIMITAIIIILMISVKCMISRYLEEWREVDVDNIAKMRNCECYRCRHMIALYEEYLLYSEQHNSDQPHFIMGVTENVTGGSKLQMTQKGPMDR